MNKIPIILIFLIFISCSSQQKKCSKFKTGTFKYEDTNLVNWVIKRNDSLQVETDKITNKETIASVHWISDCQYKLTYLKVIDSSMNDQLGTSITIDILSTSEKFYSFKAYNKDFTFKDKMILIED